PPPFRHSFPTRRSSDLRAKLQMQLESESNRIDAEKDKALVAFHKETDAAEKPFGAETAALKEALETRLDDMQDLRPLTLLTDTKDRKSTRLNSSHVATS